MGVEEISRAIRLVGLGWQAEHVAETARSSAEQEKQEILKEAREIAAQDQKQLELSRQEWEAAMTVAQSGAPFFSAASRTHTRQGFYCALFSMNGVICIQGPPLHITSPIRGRIGVRRSLGGFEIQHI